MNSANLNERLVNSPLTRSCLDEERESSTLVNDGSGGVLVDSTSLRVETVSEIPQGREGFNKRRLINKSGELKVLPKNVPRKMRRYLSDIFTTMIDLRWKWVIFIFVASYIISWVLFGFTWWLVAYLRGSIVCVHKVNNWTSAFLFSVETQETIGYGQKAITTNCPEAVILLQLQSLVGLLIDAFMLGLTFAKLSRPRERMRTVMFSDYAVIAPRDGKMCLMFRVGDVRKSQIVDASVQMQLFKTTTTKEGKEIPFHQEDLKVCYDWRNPDNDFRNQLFLLLPMVIIHVIDENSPFYDVTPQTLQESDFEIVVVIDGVVEATGLNTQPKSSYLNSEILWGYDFCNTLEKSHFGVNGFYNVDFSRLNDLHTVDTPRCSPKEYYRRQRKAET